MKMIGINILTPSRLVSKEEGEAILEVLGAIYPALLPEHFGNYEPLRHKFDYSHIAGALEYWKNEFIWKRRKPFVEGGVWMASGAYQIHGWITLRVDAMQTDISLLVQAVEALSCRLHADWASIHLLAAEEISRSRASDSVICSDPKKGIYAHSVTTHQLKKYVPDLYWLTRFGPAYVSFFGRDRLLSSPAVMAEELSDGSISLRLSETPFDIETQYPVIEARRRAIKEHLGINAFFDPGLPKDHKYGVPDFDLEADGNVVLFD